MMNNCLHIANIKTMHVRTANVWWQWCEDCGCLREGGQAMNGSGMVWKSWQHPETHKEEESCIQCAHPDYDGFHTCSKFHAT